MPQLLMFVPCEKALISDPGKTISIITILDTVTVGIPAGFDIPDDATIPMHWYTVTQWRKLPDDTNKRYEQRITVLMPDRHQVTEMIVEFEFAGKAHTHIGSFMNFPVGKPGNCFIALALREAVGRSNWKEIVRFPVTVIHGSDTISLDTSLVG